MKLDQTTISYIQKVVKTAQLVNIDNIIIEPDTVRAIDDDNTVIIFQEEDVQSLPFGSIGLNRIGVFSSRLDIVKTQDQFSVDAIIDDDNEFARSLAMSSKGIKIDYRCANPTTIKAPKKMKDEMMYRVPLNAEAVLLLTKGQSAMGAEIVTFISNTEGVSLEIVDINGDVFSHKFADEVEQLESGDGMFAHRYPIKTLLPLFKNDTEGYFEVGRKGIMSILVNGLNVFVLPQI